MEHMEQPMTMLELDQVESGYGETMVTHGVSLAIAPAQTHHCG